MEYMSKPTPTLLSITAPAATASALTAIALFALHAHAQSPAKSAPPPAGIVGDAERGAEQFEATCAECHGAAATAPTLRGIIDRPIASVASYYGYSEAMKAKKPALWTVANLDAYLKSPPTFAPGNLMYREYPDAQMRADIIAFLATLPPPR
jgi:cytochrome c2